MRPKLILAFVLIASIPAWLALAQERVPRTQENESSLKLPQKVDEASVVRISTNLVQVDVTVTDKDGVQIADLKPEEFEIYEDGQLQEITAFTNVGSSSQLRSRVDSSVGGLDPNTAYSRTPPPPIRLRPDQVRRTIAIVVPSLSFASTFAVRETLKDFIRDRLEPNDLVGIFAPRLNLLQQFTSDRNLLALAVRRIVWRPGRDPSIDFFDATRRDFEEKLRRTRDELANPSGGNPSRDPLSPAMIRAGYFGTDEQTSLFASGLGLLIQDMRKLPGRKAIVLFSDGMALNSSLEGKLRLLTDFANRSAVTIHTVHAVGLVNTDYIGADETFTEEQRDQVRNGRARALFNWSGEIGRASCRERV